jgi:formiminotetrahydrofolate cyclodeaminase
MVGMVANLTLGKKAYSLYQEAATEVLSCCQELIARLKDLTAQDMAAYQSYIEAFRLPRSTREEETAREQALEQAGQAASEVPLAICQACVEIIIQAHVIADFGNRMAVSDAGAGVHLAWGALQASMLTVRINLLSLKNQSFIALTQARQRDILEEGQRLSQEALNKIEHRLAD